MSSSWTLALILGSKLASGTFELYVSGKADIVDRWRPSRAQASKLQVVHAPPSGGQICGNIGSQLKLPTIDHDHELLLLVHEEWNILA
ncbi:uncharacterized protein EI90DRAFT_3048589 [Cantharellus anzutake]|uniref:uncharacterized protein n=1 Tax=Cantharellus anzutake TaxID=1750568 RepID=UPI001903B35B|nr:uncharacterized protein EI90DRAFT_3048589 [Cantharellus anzutake]KAF8335496.1 hypothetical protein EI90DRAFT_3048589 [Cantharellus anzutake]